jgi:gas vesicle protein
MHDQDLGNYGNHPAHDIARGGSPVMGFVLGVVVGAGVALLLAPAAGVETRRRLGDTARRLRENAKDKIGQARGTLNEITEDAKSAFQTGREAFSRTRQERTSGTPTV